MSDQSDLEPSSLEPDLIADEPYDRRQAVEKILLEDDSLTGRIYQYDLEGKSPAEIAATEGNKGAAFVYNYRLQIEALLKWEVPASPWAARSLAAKLRRWIKTLELDDRFRED